MAAAISSLASKLAFRWLPSLMWWVILVSCIPLVVLIFAQVWMRYIFHVPMLWVEEIAITPAFWFYMMGAAYAVYERTHIRVDIVEIAIHNPKRRLIIRFIFTANHIFYNIHTIKFSIHYFKNLFLYWNKGKLFFIYNNFNCFLRSFSILFSGLLTKGKKSRSKSSHTLNMTK